MATNGFKYAKLGNVKLYWFWLVGGSTIISQSVNFIGKMLTNFWYLTLTKQVRFLSANFLKDYLLWMRVLMTVQKL